jgi:glycosyltransferase involved in cell wall biosynthesis
VASITMIPDRNSGNVYTVLLYRALEEVGLRYVDVPFSLPYLLRHPPFERFHYLHFHWPEIFFEIRPRAPHKLFGMKGYLHLHAFWHLAKLRGYKLAWTVHEVDVHDLERDTAFHAGSRRLLWRLADVVFTHTHNVREEAERRWGPRSHLHTIPIGSYEGAYPDSISGAEAREQLGIPDDAFVFLFFGNVRPYKGIDLLIHAFRVLLPEHPRAHLVIAGRPYSNAFASEMRMACRDLRNTHLTLGHVPDENIQIYMRAANCFVAPYRHIETCSAIYLALAFELPIIIKAEGNVTDFADQNIGILMHDSCETESAMRHMLQMSAEERGQLRHNTLAASRLFSWKTLQGLYCDAFAAFEAHRDDPAPDRTRRAAPPVER